MSTNYLQQKRDRFYYFIVTDLQKILDYKLSILLDEETLTLTTFLSEYSNSTFKTTSEIHLARFWKDKMSAMMAAEKLAKIQEQKGNRVIFNLQYMNRQDFIKTIPDLKEIPSYVYLKNKKYKESEIKYLENLSKFRSQYKAIGEYQQVENPYNWLNCPICGLKPIVWEFNNGRSTACGCGENEYKHHSIRAESIMSYVNRNNGSVIGYDRDELRKNWNYWCKTGEILFTPSKERW
jgi:hypothetical protein